MNRTITEIIMHRDIVIKTVKALFNENGNFDATFYMKDSSDRLLLFPVNMFMRSEETKNMLANIVRKVVEEKNIDTLIFCTEAWVSNINMSDEEEKKKKLDENGHIKVMPRDDPERREVIMISTECREFGFIDFSYMEISRDFEGKATLGEIKKMNGADSMQGRFMHFIKPDIAIKN